MYNFILENFDNTKQQEIDIWYRNNIQVNNKVYTTIPNLIRQIGVFLIFF